jgi:hypothetical protein
MTQTTVFTPVSDVSQCPVLDHARQVLEHSANLGKSVRRLRVAMRQCTECPHNGECAPMIELNQAIHAAIEQISLELGFEWHQPL